MNPLTAPARADRIGKPEEAPRRKRDEYLHAIQVVLTVLFVGLALWNLSATVRGDMGQFVGLDFGHYLDATRRWIDTGTPFLAHEVAGPFQFTDLTFLHPPIALLLFAPFLALPGILFWVIPLLGTAVIVVTWRPARWVWPIMALQLSWPRFGGAVVVGNTDLWVLLFIALGLRFGWPVILLVLKPSIAPIALPIVGVLVWAGEWSVRRWKELALVTALVAVLAIPFGTLWLDWAAVVRNSPGDPLYSIGALPWLSIPVVAWLGRRTETRSNSSTAERAA